MEEKQLTYWRVIGIGVIVGLCATGLVYLIFLSIGVGFIGLVFAAFFSVLGIPVCILGAVIGKYRKNSPKATWGGAIVGAVLASIIVFFVMANTCWGMC